MAQALIEMRGIVKKYPGVCALDDVEFSLRAGEVHALVGENGAGKSTLIKILTGAEQRDRGEIFLNGAAIEARSPLDAQRLGIATVYQEVNLIPDLSVAENVMLGREKRHAFGGIDWRSMRRRAREIVERLGLFIDVTLPLGSYSIAVGQMIAVARALDMEARVLVLDEPTSSLDRDETAQLFELMRTLRGRGIGIVFITHYLEQVFEISDRVTVLRGGRVVGLHETKSLDRLTLVSEMLGQAMDRASGHEVKEKKSVPVGTGREVLRVVGVSRRHAIEAFDLSLRAGEVLGLGGLLGSGRSEMVRLLFGIDRRDGGAIEINGRPMKRVVPGRAIRAGMAMTPEDRRRCGIVPELSVRDNMMLALQGARGWARRLALRDQRAIVDRFVKALNIATPDMEKAVGQLSGGNQQKVILARWLCMEPMVLMLDEPTRGIDIGAKEQIQVLIEKLRSGGMGLIFISAELDEIVRVSQRVMILRDRRVAGELAGEEVSSARVMEQIAGAHGESTHA